MKNARLRSRAKHTTKETTRLPPSTKHLFRTPAPQYAGPRSFGRHALSGCGVSRRYGRTAV